MLQVGGELRHGFFVELEDDFFFVVGGEVPVGCCGSGDGVGRPGVAFPGVGAAGGVAAGAAVIAGVGVGIVVVVVVAGVAGVAVLVVVVCVAIVATGAAAAVLPVANRVSSHIEKSWLVRVLWMLILTMG